MCFEIILRVRGSESNVTWTSTSRPLPRATWCSRSLPRRSQCRWTMQRSGWVHALGTRTGAPGSCSWTGWTATVPCTRKNASCSRLLLPPCLPPRPRKTNPIGYAILLLKRNRQPSHPFLSHPRPSHPHLRHPRPSHPHLRHSRPEPSAPEAPTPEPSAPEAPTPEPSAPEAPAPEPPEPEPPEAPAPELPEPSAPKPPEPEPPAPEPPEAPAPELPEPSAPEPPETPAPEPPEPPAPEPPASEPFDEHTSPGRACQTDDDAWTRVFLDGQEVLAVPGLLPPAVLTSLADQRVVLPARGPQARVAIFRDRGRVRFGPYAVDLNSYKPHIRAYVCTGQMTSHSSLPPERRGGNVARRHRIRQQAYERR